MATINVKNNKKTAIELKEILDAQGCKMAEIRCDGQYVCTAGYTSETDKKAVVKAIETAIENSANIYDAIVKLNTIARMPEKVEKKLPKMMVNGYVITYDIQLGEAYRNNEIVAKLTVSEMKYPVEAKLSLLKERARVWVVTET